MNIRRLTWRSFISDKTGSVELWQTPNLSLYLWFGSTLLARIFQSGEIHGLFAVVAFGALYAWSWQEIIEGTSPFRRVLGVVVLLAILGSLLK